MTGDAESAALFGNVGRQNRHGHLDIQNHAAACAMDVIMTLGATVIPAGLVGEGQFLNQTVLNQKMERTVDRAIADLGITSPYALKDFGCGQVLVGTGDNLMHQRTLGSWPERTSVQIRVLSCVQFSHVIPS